MWNNENTWVCKIILYTLYICKLTNKLSILYIKKTAISKVLGCQEWRDSIYGLSRISHKFPKYTNIPV